MAHYMTYKRERETSIKMLNTKCLAEIKRTLSNVHLTGTGQYIYRYKNIQKKTQMKHCKVCLTSTNTYTSIL